MKYLRGLLQKLIYRKRDLNEFWNQVFKTTAELKEEQEDDEMWSDPDFLYKYQSEHGEEIKR